ncbi:MAG: hypothetical protein IJT73_06080 [Selenomonadaceae bacterium]|nr:hypothetical protein [Selenomonadaceae bacterium]
MDKKLRIGVVAGIAALAVAGGGYFLLTSDRDKPEYAFQTVEKAVENHNKADFYKVVDLESILDDSYSSIVEGVTDADKTMTADARVAIKNFTEMLREPLLLSLKAAIDSYLETGEFNKTENSSVEELLKRTGLDKFQYRGVDSIGINPRNADEATAKVRIYQPELGGEFVFDVLLRRNSKDEWQIVSLPNFQDFINQLNSVRRVQLDKYLEASAEINARHDAAILEAEENYDYILSTGTLGQDDIRADLKTLMLDVVKKDWEARKQELFSLQVPLGAETLHNLRMKICDLEIGYAEDYAQWMVDKKAVTAKSAEDKKNMAKTLKAEDNALTRRMSN